MLKRIFDTLLILISLPITLPIILITYIVLLFIDGRPVFFRQRRLGKNNKEFMLIKFRTMKNGSESDQQRITRFGNILRKLSIDELPELYNILKGEMSLVGPRPLPTSYLDHYDSSEIKRHDVTPGLTGLAQVNGRNAISWRNKFKYDLEYVNNNSIWIDIKIIIQTFLTLTRVSSVNASDNTTMMPLTERLHIIGAGGHSKVIIELAHELGHEIKGIYESDASKIDQEILGYTIKDQAELKDINLRVLAIGNNKVRKKLDSTNHKYAVLIHPKAMVSKSAKLGEGSVVFNGATIQSSTVIGKHVIVNTGSKIDHDCKVFDYCHIAPGVTICGDVTIKESNFIGAASTIVPQITIEEENMIAAGSTVNKDIKSTKKLWAGSPAVVKKDI